MSKLIIKKGNYVVFGSSGMMGSHFLKRVKNLKGINIIAVYFRNKPKIIGENTFAVGLIGLFFVLHIISYKKSNISEKISKMNF